MRRLTRRGLRGGAAVGHATQHRETLDGRAGKPRESAVGLPADNLGAPAGEGGGPPSGAGIHLAEPGREAGGGNHGVDVIGEQPSTRSLWNTATTGTSRRREATAPIAHNAAGGARCTTSGWKLRSALLHLPRRQRDRERSVHGQRHGRHAHHRRARVFGGTVARATTIA